MSTNQLKLSLLCLNWPHQVSHSLFHPHPASPNVTRSSLRHWSDVQIHAYFEEPVWILNLCLWNQRALFATLSLACFSEF
jgi:hypothetical protein